MPTAKWCGSASCGSSSTITVHKGATSTVAAGATRPGAKREGEDVEEATEADDAVAAEAADAAAAEDEAGAEASALLQSSDIHHR